MNVDS